MVPLIKKPTQLDDDIKEWLVKEFEEGANVNPLEDDDSSLSEQSCEGGDEGEGMVHYQYNQEQGTSSQAGS